MTLRDVTLFNTDYSSEWAINSQSQQPKVVEFGSFVQTTILRS